VNFTSSFSLGIAGRPFKVVPKPDGRPAIEVEFNGKQQQYVSYKR
jgi:hypothetical protein